MRASFSSVTTSPESLVSIRDSRLSFVLEGLEGAGELVEGRADIGGFGLDRRSHANLMKKPAGMAG